MKEITGPEVARWFRVFKKQNEETQKEQQWLKEEGYIFEASKKEKE